MTATAEPAYQSRMNPCYAVGWRFFRLMFRFYFRWRAYNPERVPLQGPVIIAANHASYIDPPLVGSAIHRQINFLARASLFKIPVLAAILRSWEVVPVDRDGGTGRGLKVILDRLERGGAIILFPEGTRTRDGQLAAARSGLGLVVIKSTAPVVPARVFGTYEAYGRHKLIPLPRRVAVKYSQPLQFAALRAEAKTCSRDRAKEIYQQVSDEVLQIIASLEPKGDPI